VRHILAVTLGPIKEEMDWQRCCLGDFLGREVVACSLGVEALIRIRRDWLELSVDTKQCHQVLRAAALEFEDVGFVVADMAKQLMPERPFAI